MSAVGSTETYLAKVAGTPEFIGSAAFDAGRVDVEPQAGRLGTLSLDERRACAARGNRTPPRRPAALELGHSLYRGADEAHRVGRDRQSPPVCRTIWRPADCAAWAVCPFRDIRESALKDMYGLFDDDPRLGPSLQAQLFIYSGVGAPRRAARRVVGAAAESVRFPHRRRDRVPGPRCRP